MVVSALAQTKLLIAEQHLHSIIKFFYNSKLSYYNFFCPGSDIAEATGQAPKQQPRMSMSKVFYKY